MHKAVRSWNKFINSMIKTRAAWEKHRELMEERPNVDEESYLAQKLLLLTTNRSKFDIAIPRLLDQWRRMGGLDEMVIPTEPEEETVNV